MSKEKMKPHCATATMLSSGIRIVKAINSMDNKKRKTYLKANLGSILAGAELTAEEKYDVLEQLNVEFIMIQHA